MATPAELLDNMVPVSAFSRGKAAQAFSSASNSTPVIVLKNNAPSVSYTHLDVYKRQGAHQCFAVGEVVRILPGDAVQRLDGLRDDLRTDAVAG